MKVVHKKFTRPDATLGEARKTAEKDNPRGRLPRELTVVGARRGAGADGSAPSIYVPTAEQLTKINLYTRSPKTADEVACFDTWSCNDQLDRDLDSFTAAT